MGAHALGAAAYAVTAAALAQPERDDAIEEEVVWQLAQLSPEARSALASLPALGTDTAGPLGAGLLASGTLGTVIRRLQADLGGPPVE
jgi:hypothetical protein